MHAEAAETQAKFLFQELLAVVTSCTQHSSGYFPRPFYSHFSLALPFAAPRSRCSRNSSKCWQVNTHSPRPSVTELLPAMKDTWTFPSQVRSPWPWNPHSHFKYKVSYPKLTQPLQRGEIQHTVQRKPCDSNTHHSPILRESSQVPTQKT